MYAGTADMVKIESDERGFELHINTDEGYFSFNVHGVAVELLEEIKRTIEQWYAEGESVRMSVGGLTYEDGVRAREAYDRSDPKHPDYHDHMASMWDDREK